MTLWPYLITNTALGLVLLRMRAAQLDATRPADFCFALAIFTASQLSLAVPPDAPGYPFLYLLLSFAPWLFGARLLARALGACAATQEPVCIALMALGAAALAGHEIFFLHGASFATQAFTAAAWWGFLAGALLLLASSRSIGTAPQLSATDALLARGFGSFYTAGQAGMLLLAAQDASAAWFDALLLAQAALWFAFAWHITPRGDALINEEILAVSGQWPVASATLFTGRQSLAAGHRSSFPLHACEPSTPQALTRAARTSSIPSAGRPPAKAVAGNCRANSSPCAPPQIPSGTGSAKSVDGGSR